MLHQHDKPTVPAAVLTAAPLSPVLDPHPPVSESGGRRINRIHPPLYKVTQTLRSVTQRTTDHLKNVFG